MYILIYICLLVHTLERRRITALYIYVINKQPRTGTEYYTTDNGQWTSHHYKSHDEQQKQGIKFEKWQMQLNFINGNLSTH